MTGKFVGGNRLVSNSLVKASDRRAVVLQRKPDGQGLPRIAKPDWDYKCRAARPDAVRSIVRDDGWRETDDEGRKVGPQKANSIQFLLLLPLRHCTDCASSTLE